MAFCCSADRVSEKSLVFVNLYTYAKLMAFGLWALAKSGGRCTVAKSVPPLLQGGTKSGLQYKRAEIYTAWTMSNLRLLAGLSDCHSEPIRALVVVSSLLWRFTVK